MKHFETIVRTINRTTPPQSTRSSKISAHPQGSWMLLATYHKPTFLRKFKLYWIFRMAVGPKAWNDWNFKQCGSPTHFQVSQVQKIQIRISWSERCRVPRFNDAVQEFQIAKVQDFRVHRCMGTSLENSLGSSRALGQAASHWNAAGKLFASLLYTTTLSRSRRLEHYSKIANTVGLGPGNMARKPAPGRKQMECSPEKSRKNVRLDFTAGRVPHGMPIMSEYMSNRMLPDMPDNTKIDVRKNVRTYVR